MQHDQTYLRRTPTPQLQRLVSGIFAYAEGGLAMDRATEPAGLDVPFIVNFGGPFEIALGREPTAVDRYSSFAAGLYAGPVVMSSDGGAQCIQVNFTPLGGRLFYRRPLIELAGRMAPLADLEDREISCVAMRLGELNDWEARLDAVETFVTFRLHAEQIQKTEIAWALSQIETRKGALPIAWLCTELGWSRRRLAETMRHEFGLTPKTIARIARFKAAEDMALASKRPLWADIASACGYADQAHLTREFADLAGRSPTVFVAAA